jgi:hypothetical protein
MSTSNTYGYDPSGPQGRSKGPPTAHAPAMEI